VNAGPQRNRAMGVWLGRGSAASDRTDDLHG
jgi:hypothetical protein